MNQLNYRTTDFFITPEMAAKRGHARNALVVPDLNGVIDRWVTIIVYHSVNHSNPGGEVDNGGNPSQDYDTGKGQISTFNVKRKIRDTVLAVYGRKLFHVRGSVLVDRALAAAEAQGIPVEEIQRLKDLIEVQKKEPPVVNPDAKPTDEADATPAPEAAQSGKKRGKAAKEPKPAKKEGATAKRGTLPSLPGALLREYWDQRMFGASGTESSNHKHVGALQTLISHSLHRVDPIEHTLTNCAVGSYDEKARKDNNIGRFEVVRFGLYEIVLYANPTKARDAGATWQDLNDLLNGLQVCRSVTMTSRTAGVAHERGYVFVHNAANQGHDDNLVSLTKLIRPRNAPGCTLSDNEARLSMDQYSLVDAAEVTLPESIQTLITF